MWRFGQAEVSRFFRAAQVVAGGERDTGVTGAARGKSGTEFAVTPARFLLPLLAIVFVSEGAMMLVLPVLLPKGMSATLGALSDASSLTLIIAPAVWLLLIRPLQARARLLFDPNDRLRQTLSRNPSCGIP
jgi:hypothetical protein